MMTGSSSNNNCQGRILVVEDNDATRYALSRHLKHAGYDVLEAGTGGEGLRLAEKATPDVILLDAGLPDLNGLEVCRDLKRNPLTARSAVIQVSAAYTSSEDRVRALEGGADSYLAHPFPCERWPLAPVIRSEVIAGEELRVRRGHRRSFYEGTGLGLAIVKRAASRMGGAVGVESQPGQGSRF